MAIVIAATAYSHWQTLAPWLETVAGASTDWERSTDWYAQAGTALPKSSRVLILHCRPEYAIANAMQQGTPPVAALKQWQASTAAILAYFRRNRRHTTLLEVASALRQPERLAEHLGPHLEHPLQAPEHRFSPTKTPPLLLQALAAQMVAQAPELGALMSEVEASTLPLDEQTWQPVSMDIGALAAQLDAAQAQAQKQTDELTKALTAALEETASWQKKLPAAEAEFKKQIASLQQEQQAKEQALAETREENELLLLQLHQVQEELESTFLKAQTDGEQRKRLEGENARLTAELNAEKARSADIQNALAKVRTVAKKRAEDLATVRTVAKKRAEDLATVRAVAKKRAEDLTAVRSMAKKRAEDLATVQAVARNRAENLAKLEATLKAEKARSTNQQSVLDAAEKETVAVRKALTAARREVDLGKKALVSAQEQAKKRAETLAHEHEQSLQAAHTEIATLRAKIQELEKSPLRKTLAAVQAITRRRDKRKREHAGKAEAHTFEQEIALIQSSGLFNAEWYLQAYPEVAKADIGPLEHYLKHGAAEGLNPSTEFDTQFYLSKNGDVREAAINPLLHYIQYGREEGRPPKG